MIHAQKLHATKIQTAETTKTYPDEIDFIDHKTK